MTFEKFQEQIQRLEKTFGERYYPEERVKVFWRTLRYELDEDFEDAVTYAIANLRGAPMLDDLAKELDQAKRRRIENCVTDGRRGEASVLGVLKNAESLASDPEAKEFAKSCVRILADKLENRLSEKQFAEACEYLDQTAKTVDQTCPECNGDGYTFVDHDAHRYLYRCQCPIGQRRALSALGPANKNGEREIVELRLPG